jgi:hypothetical protein
MDIVTRSSAARRGQTVNEQKLSVQKQMFQSLVEEQVRLNLKNPYFTFLIVL